MPEPTRTLSKARVALLLMAPLALLGIAWGTPLALQTRWNKPVPPPPAVELSGAQVFAQNCAYCHGINGDGRGSMILQPPARYFGRDKFKFATTINGMPTDDDLMHVLARGIPGSAMPSFAKLPKEQCEAVIQHVRELARQGLYDRQVQKAESVGDDPEPEKFAINAAVQSVPGPKLAIPVFGPNTPEAVARGRQVYLKLCVACHGPDGHGDGPNTKLSTFINDDGTPARPRDLTLGQYKGGGEPADLYARIMLGIPGTPMPASNTQPQAEILDLIQYIQSLPKKP